ncbi:unnamed protein product, partial [Medioppia subpectinata]
MGVTTGWSGGTRLVHLLGPTKALDLLASGRVVSADEALAIGFVNHVFDDMTTTDQFIQEIVQWLKEYINCTSHSGGYSHEAVVYALKNVGYRLIDTAKRYGTEKLIHQAIEESCIPREELFLTTKLWPTDYGFETTKAAIRGSLDRLGVDYIDLFLIHWPEV